MPSSARRLAAFSAKCAAACSAACAAICAAICAALLRACSAAAARAFPGAASGKGAAAGEGAALPESADLGEGSARPGSADLGKGSARPGSAGEGSGEGAARPEGAASGGSAGGLPGKGSGLGGRALEAFTGSDAPASIAVVALGFLAATAILLAIGRNPAGMYQAIAQVTTGFDLRRWGDWEGLLATRNLRHVGEWLVISSPLILCGLSMAFAARAGLFNIGAEGQYIMGLTAAQLLALTFPPIPALHQAVSVAGGVLAGAAWGGVVGFFKARFGVSEVVATIMMNHIALFSHRIAMLGLPGALPNRTPDFPDTASMASPFLSAMFGGSRLNHGVWLTLAAVAAFWIVMGKTRLGFALRATGMGRDAAMCCGIGVKSGAAAAMAIAGAFAGLAGSAVALGGLFPSFVELCGETGGVARTVFHGRVLSGFEGYGFDGIAVALVGSSAAWGVALAGLLFGMLRSAQPIMQMRGIPAEITSIIIGLVVIFISLRAGLRMAADWRMKEQARRSRERAAADASAPHPPGEGEGP